jgi:tripartite-type tricarboxylate transporter receptor subunit TctC
MPSVLKKLSLALITFLLLSAGAQVSAQITLIVPYAAGGSSDAIARMLIPAISSSLGQTVSVLNVLGRQGVKGALDAAGGPRDGSVMLFGDLALANALRNENSGVSLLDNFDAVGIIGEKPLVLFSAKSGRITALEQLRNAGRIGSTQAGTVSAQCAAALEKHLSGSTVYQPFFAGVAPLVQAVLSGTVDAACIDASSMVGAGQLPRVLATSAPTTHPAFSGVKTFKEHGLDIEYRGVVGLFVVKGVSPHTVKKLEEAVTAATSDPSVRAKLQDFFLTLDPVAGVAGTTSRKVDEPSARGTTAPSPFASSQNHLARYKNEYQERCRPPLSQSEKSYCDELKVDIANEEQAMRLRPSTSDQRTAAPSPNASTGGSPTGSTPTIGLRSGPNPIAGSSTPQPVTSTDTGGRVGQRTAGFMYCATQDYQTNENYYTKIFPVTITMTFTLGPSQEESARYELGFQNFVRKNYTPRATVGNCYWYAREAEVRIKFDQIQRGTAIAYSPEMDPGPPPRPAQTR